MLSYSQYQKKHIPVVHFDIRDRTLTESVDHHYLGFIGNKGETPQSLGYMQHPRHAPLYTHPDVENKVFHFSGTNVPKAFDSVGDALYHHDTLESLHDKTVEDTANELTTHYAKAGLSDEEKENLSFYTGPDANINHRILRNTLFDSDVYKMYHLDSALRKGTTPKHLVVYSGTDAAHSKILGSSDLVHHPAYISSSLGIKNALDFAGTKNGSVNDVHIPEGHHGLYMQEHSDLPEEREFLLPRGMILKLDHSKRQLISKYRGEPVVMHHANVAL